MEFQTIIVGNREYSFATMDVLLANALFMRTKKVFLPVLASGMELISLVKEGGQNLGDIDVKDAAKIIGENLDESMIANIVIPLFSGCALSDVESKRKLNTETAIRANFTAHELFDFYQLIFEVARFQFSPFLGQIKDLFGNLSDAKPKAELTES